MLMWAKIRAKERNLPFSITVEDIMIPEFCPVLGIRLEPGTRQKHDASPTLDRIIPDLGYVPSNVRVISMRANRIKADATLEELERVVRYVKRETKPPEIHKDDNQLPLEIIQ
jgi:hypothetical protein